MEKLKFVKNIEKFKKKKNKFNYNICLFCTGKALNLAHFAN